MKFAMRVPPRDHVDILEKGGLGAQLLRLGYHPGLGLAEDGICYPMSLPTLLGTFGLGFDPKVHFELRTSHCGFID